MHGTRNVCQGSAHEVGRSLCSENCHRRCRRKLAGSCLRSDAHLKGFACTDECDADVTVLQNFFKSFIDVEGDCVDDGWVDDSAPSQPSGGFVSGLFGGGRAASSPAAAMSVEGVKTNSGSEWKEILDPASGSPYYWNENTGETTWEKPAGM